MSIETTNKPPEWVNLVGDGPRDLFEVKLMELLGDTRLLWIPRAGDTTTSTDRSRNAATITWDATIAARVNDLGLGHSITFDGTNDEGDISPDSDIYSFGDGVADSPFSIVALIKPDDYGVTSVVIAKENSASAEEWRLDITSTNGYPRLFITDESASAYIGREDQTAFGTSWGLIAATYDGSKAASGISLVKNGAIVDDADVTSGSYDGMENTAALVHIGARYTTKERFFDGDIALVALCAKALTIDENWAIKSLINSFYDLSL